MRVALAQISPHLGELQKNLEIHLRVIERSLKKKADLVIFPELSLTGYTLKDLAGEMSLDPATDARFRKILARTKGLSVVLGFMESFTKELPMEYAVELNRLIELQLKGAVG